MAAAVEAARAEAQQAAENREIEAKEKEAAAAEALADIAEWPSGTGSGCRVLERCSLKDLCEQVLFPPEQNAAEGADGDTAGDNPEPDGDAAAADAEPVGEAEPRFADGTKALDTLNFDIDWLQDCFGKSREGIFKNIQVARQYLERVDIPAACEEVRRELDQRLRRHTNRKGEVQVDWYVPRYGIVAKHKDKFERHLVYVARKCQDQDDTVDAIFVEVEQAEAELKQRLLDLRERLGEAETLPVLTSFERQADKFVVAFKDCCKSALKRLLDLSSRAPQALQKENRSFLAICRSGDEQYSETEISFYGGEIEELNGTLDERAQKRAQKATELEGQIDEKQREPLAEFMEAYSEAVETLCATKGYGRKYGAPRRKAQERVRTLIARASTVRSNIQELLDYVQRLLEISPPEDGGVDISLMPPSPSTISLKTFFQRGGDPWAFTGELLGIIYVLVCSMAALGSHLGAFKDAQAPRYMLSAVPNFRILREDETLMPAAEVQQEVRQNAAKDIHPGAPPEEQTALEIARKDYQSLQAETALREDALLRVLGPLLKSENFNNEIQSIVKVSNEAYAGQPGGTPEFMQKFLSDMQVSSEYARQEACRELRAWGDELRERTLLTLGESLFSELTSRSIAEMLGASQDARQKTVRRWVECDKLRATHEQSLNPSLSNPNAEAQLTALVEAEAARYESATVMCQEDRENMASALRNSSEAFVRRLTSLVEESIRLMDLLPLHIHFGALPGDEKVERPRMSIKRRLRRLNAEAEAVPASPVDAKAKAKADPKAKSKPDPAAAVEPAEEPGLPERQWPGLPRYELRSLLSGDGWPKDDVLALEEQAEDGATIDPQKVQERTSSLNSFRSPVHRSIIDRRAHYYEVYKSAFVAEVERRTAELTARELKEESGGKNWQSMVRQLRGEVEH
eukprot:TRINITY_DN24625_c0_g1_i3.p1 TRINITY_DN24625_c0_g1~~TRINITY_DN24625_c0_g1_i3.p1  ORF type:complete len:918 (-),score=218.72 TRINITY_DN24625_c0_g1_i3:395-3148(-)